METMQQDRHIEEVKRDFVARVDEINRRFQGIRGKFDEVKKKLDLGRHIEKRPFAAIGIAFAAGALLGMTGGKRTVVHEGAVKRTAGGAIAGALGAFVMSVLKDYAFRQVSGVAQDWFTRREVAMSHQHETEAFLNRT